MKDRAPEDAGWIVRVLMDADSDRPISIMYAAAYVDATDAQEAVRYNRSREDEDVEAVHHLSWETRRRLQLKSGDVWPL